MRKFKLFFACMLMTLFSVGQVWGADEVYKSLTFPDDNSSNNGLTSNQYLSTWTATSGSDSWSITNFNNNNWQNNWAYIKCGRKNNTSVAKITTGAAIDKAITKVVITIDALTAAKINSITLYSSSDNSTWTSVGTFTKATGNQTVTISSPAEDLYYKIEFDCASGSSNGLLTLSKVEYYKAVAANVCATPTFTAGDESFLTSTSVTLACETSGASLYYTTNGETPTSSSTLYEGAIPVSATTTIKAIAVKSGMTNSVVAEKTFTKATVMTVAQARAAIDAGGDLSNKFVAGVISQIDSYNSTYNSITYWISDDGTTTDQLQVYSGKAGVVKEAFASKDDLAVGDDVTVKGTLKKYNSTYEFDKNNTIEAYKPIARLAWSAASFDASLEGANSFPTLTSSVTVSYSSSNTDAATINPATGAITLKAVGSTTITASFAGSETIKANSASYELTIASSLVTLTYNVDGGEAIESVNVNALPNPLPTTTKAGKNFGGWFTDSEKTVEAVPGAAISENTTIYAKWLDPYTVSQAKAVIDDAPDGTANQYVAGIISQVDSYNSTYKSITYWISADGTTTDQLQVYSGKGLNGANFSEKADLQVGDQVVVTGTLKKYGEIYEFDKNNTIYSFNRPAPKYTVRFWNSEGWDNVYAFVWDDTQAYEGDWPGLNITSQIEGGWHYYQIEEGRNIIFTAGFDGPQTIDIKDVQANACYILGEGTDELGHKNVVVDNDCDDRLYVAGNAELTGESWNTTADRLVNGSITFTNVPAGSHEFKITNGTWKWNVGAGAFDSENSNVENWGTDNVGFSTNAAKDITIAYDKVNNKITVTAVDYVEPVYKAIVASYGDKYYAMTTTLEGDGFTPLEVAVDADGNVIVNSDGEKNSILWKYTAGAETATFQDANNLYLAKGSGNTGLALANTAVEWTLHEDGYYYVTSGRSFFYQTNDNGGIFKNYAVSNFGEEKYSGKHILYAADKIVIRATAKFFAPASWENVYAYTYSWDEINGTTEYNGAWPGEQLTKDGDWYAISMPIGAKVIFHNNLGGNSNQTVDIPVPESACFAWNGLENEDNPKMTVATISTCEMNNSIAGDEALTGVAEWGHTALVNNTITYNEVADGTYKFKISNGTWDWSLGGAYVDQTACSGVTIEDTDGDGNAVFSIAIKSNITITYNPATEKISIVAVASTPEILVDKAEIAFGTVDYEDAVDAEIINVTLISVANATISLSGDADAFQLDKDALTASGIVSVTPVTTTAGTFNATLTISDAASAAETKEIALSLTVNEAPAVDDINGTWNLVTSADQLAANKKVIIAKYVDADETVTLGMTQNTNNRAQVEGATVTGNVLVPAQGTAVFTLEAGTEDGTWAFKSSANEYLYAASSTKNWLRSQAENDANGSWVISIINGVASVVAQGENTHNIMRYNNGDNLFSCYTSGQQDIALYMLEEEEPEPVYETVRSGLEPDRYYTVCYDKTMKKIKGASLWSFNGKDANMAYIVEAEAPYIAGTPYLIYAESDKLEAITEAVDNPEATNNNGLYGTLEEMSNTDLLAAGATHLLVNNELRPLGNGYLKANRAYVKLGEIQNTTPTPSNAPGKRVRAIPMHQDAATGIDELNASEKPVKMVIDGQLYILRGEKMYDATGRLVK